MNMNLTRIDRAALAAAIEVARSEDAGRRQQIDNMLADAADRPGGWEDVARFASSCAQARSLQAQPWQTLPQYASLDSLRDPYGDPSGAREAAELLKKMLALGISKYEPNPLAAIAEAEKRQAAQ